MTPAEYKQKLREFFSGLSVRDSESQKLQKLEQFRKTPGVRKHLKKLVLLAFAFFNFATISFAQQTTVIPESGDEEYGSLAENFRTGNFEFSDIGLYIRYLIELMIYFGGGLAVLFIVIGGYQYMIGGVSDDKEAGKKTITYALTGFIVAVMAWTVVNATQLWATGGDDGKYDLDAPSQLEVSEVIEKYKQNLINTRKVAALIPRGFAQNFVDQRKILALISIRISENLLDQRKLMAAILNLATEIDHQDEVKKSEFKTLIEGSELSPENKTKILNQLN